MTWFVLAALVLALLATLWLLAPLWRRGAARVEQSVTNLAVLRDQLAELERDLAQGAISAERYAQAKGELERRALEEGAGDATPSEAPRRGVRSAIMALGIAVPLAALALYLALGNPRALLRELPDPGREQDAAHRAAALLADLAAGLERYPEEARGWTVLGRLYGALGRNEESARAYARLVEIVKDDADALADYAFALAQSQDRRIDAKVRHLVERALEIDPTHLKALVLAGGAASQRGDREAALRYWRAVQAQVPADSELGRAVARAIADARKDAPGSLPAPAAGVSGTVRLAPGLATRVAPEDTVFVTARAVKGPAMPLVVLRRRAAELPFAFALDDSQAMTPEMKLSDYPEVTVTARVSKSGSATRQKGDLEGVREARLGGSAVELVIDRVVQ